MLDEDEDEEKDEEPPPPSATVVPLLPSRFAPPRFLCNGHAQTILPVLLRRKLGGVFTRERLELADGDFLDLDWAQSSARQFLPRIAVPTLLLQPRNDPFLAPGAFPWAEAEASAHVFLETPDSGGHVGFLDFQRGLEPWSERRLVEFLAAIA